MSSDRTFDTDLCTEPEVHRELLRLSEEVAGRLRARNLVARTVGIKVRFADFKTVSRVRTVAEPVDLAATLYAESLALYAGLDLDRPRIRLLGVKAEGLLDAGSVSHQLSFDDVEIPGAAHAGRLSPWSRLERARVGPATDPVADAGATGFAPPAAPPSQPPGAGACPRSNVSPTWPGTGSERPRCARPA